MLMARKGKVLLASSSSHVLTTRHRHRPYLNSLSLKRISHTMSVQVTWFSPRSLSIGGSTSILSTKSWKLQDSLPATNIPMNNWGDGSGPRKFRVSYPVELFRRAMHTLAGRWTIKVRRSLVQCRLRPKPFLIHNHCLAQTSQISGYAPRTVLL